MKTTYLLLALALVGCSEQQPNPASINNPYVRYAGTPRSYAYEFRLADGTRCVTYSDAITCEWQHPVVLVPRPQ